MMTKMMRWWWQFVKYKKIRSFLCIGVVYRRLFSRQNFHENRSTKNRTEIWGVNWYLSVPYIFFSVWLIFGMRIDKQNVDENWLVLCVQTGERITLLWAQMALNLSLLTYRIWWVSSNASNFNVYYLVTYVWQHRRPSFFIVCTMSQHWTNHERRPVPYLCLNT